MGRPGAQTEVAPATGLVRQGALRTSAGASERTTAVAALTSSPPSKKGEDSYEAWFGFNQSTFGGFLFHRSALLRRISAGFTSGLPGPKVLRQKNYTPNLRLISPFSRREPHGASGKKSARESPQTREPVFLPGRFSGLLRKPRSARTALRNGACLPCANGRRLSCTWPRPVRAACRVPNRW